MKRIQRKSKKCRFERKTEYYSEASANKGKTYVWSHDPQADMFDLHVYLCPNSPVDKPHWHIGHQSYYQKTHERIHEANPRSEKF